MATTNEWTLTEGVELIRAAQPFARHAGYHLGIAGGVLNKGYSNHDLDIVVMPLNSNEHARSLEGLWRAFRILGCSEDFFEVTARYPQEHGRVIYRTTYMGKDIDLFVYERQSLWMRICRRVCSWFQIVVVVNVT